MRAQAGLPTVWVPWEAGPERGAGEVLVSLTEFRAERLGTLPAVFADGLRLRQGWFAMPGAVGLWLWARPWQRRGGSVSVWRDAESLTRFVRLPRHGATIRRFRDRGGVTETSWTQPWDDPRAVRAAIEPVLAGDTIRPPR